MSKRGGNPIGGNPGAAFSETAVAEMRRRVFSCATCVTVPAAIIGRCLGTMRRCSCGQPATHIVTTGFVDIGPQPLGVQVMGASIVRHRGIE
jgi:hypothetical protein